MATLKERVSALEDALTNDFANPLKAIVVQVDEQGRDIREQGRDIREQGRDLREVKARLATADTRLNRMDERLGLLAEDVGVLQKALQMEIGTLRAEMNQKFEQVIALLTHNKEAGNR